MVSVRRRSAPLALALASALACSGDPAETTAAASTTDASSTGASTDASSSGDPGTTAADVLPGVDAEIPLFVGEHIYFGDENHRQADVQVSLPADGAYSTITLDLALGCPDGLCDHWDRYGSIGVVQDPGTDHERVIEVARFITAYRLPAQWSLDVTALRPLLAGDLTVRVFIDTWVGPGHPQGNGWLVDARLIYEGGVPSPRPIAVLPLWYQAFDAGDPAKPIADQVPVLEIAAPIEATSFRLRTHITGHGFGNTDNCAEFCPKNHGFMVGDDPYVTTIWRDDCLETAVQDQYGTWTYPRAGWCPGADVIPWEVDLTPSLVPGQSTPITYGLATYENTCRPGLDTCVGCNAGATCDDGHSLPYYYLSSLVIAYE